MNPSDPGAASQLDAPSWFEFLDHTADTGIVVRANDLPQLFERAAWGLFAVITDMDRVRAATVRQVEVEAEDLESLLVRWLSELNYLHVTRHELFAEFTLDAISSTKLVGKAAGERIDSERHTIHTEVKAITYHGLEIRSAPDGWIAQVIFDL